MRILPKASTIFLLKPGEDDDTTGTISSVRPLRVKGVASTRGRLRFPAGSLRVLLTPITHGAHDRAKVASL